MDTISTSYAEKLLEKIRCGENVIKIERNPGLLCSAGLVAVSMKRGYCTSINQLPMCAGRARTSVRRTTPKEVKLICRARPGKPFRLWAVWHGFRIDSHRAGCWRNPEVSGPNPIGVQCPLPATRTAEKPFSV